MDKTFVPAGELDQKVDVLDLHDEVTATLGQVTRTRYFWHVERRVWAKVTPSARKNVYSNHGVGASGVTVILRHQPLELGNALRWRGRHCIITSIQPLGRAYWQVEAALVEVSSCEDKYSGTTFPAVMTERYVRFEEADPYNDNQYDHVLVTPKAIDLIPGRLVEVDGKTWHIRAAHLLDPNKNEYDIWREVEH